ncbi:hypothetical protein B9Z19DRAFT_1085552 [Tuber borchii]|uniref:Uncharacterized protein n=1 Tax=Tuber borchii TaxID=42251 RepID=A0A2T6ZQM8_TUBBO|nr:hypothetical protein B9Z19DRAFT_1085552 [Tuber borchii]
MEKEKGKEKEKEQEKEGKGVEVGKEGKWWKFVRKFRIPGKHSRPKSLTRNAA